MERGKQSCLKRSIFIWATACLLICSVVSETIAMGIPEYAEVPPQPFADLTSQEVEVGSGPEAEIGSTISVHYTGWLVDGTKFDSSYDRRQPIQFQLGRGMVISGWDQGIAGYSGTNIAALREGGKRILYIPSSMGYGARGAGGVIPPNADLIFEVELVSAGLSATKEL